MQTFLQHLIGEPVTVERNGKEAVTGTVRSVGETCVILETDDTEWAISFHEVGTVIHRKKEKEEKEEQEKGRLVRPILSRSAGNGITVF